MNLRSLAGTLAIVGIFGSTAAVAGAQVYTPVPNYQPVPNNPNGYPQNGNPTGQYRQKSEVNVANIAMRCGKLSERLQADTHDYGGHRTAAISSLQSAQNELNAAAQFAAANGYQVPVKSGAVREPRGNRSQQKSNSNIQTAQTTVGRWISHLQRDSRDFGGHRVAAINYLQQAETELAAASQYAAAHGY
jgi:hypothetical protein